MKVAILNDTTREFGHIGCKLVMRNLCELANQAGMEVIYKETDISEGFDRLLFKQRIEKSDAIIVNGEGTFHHDRGSGLFLRCQIAGELRKKIFLINSVWQDNRRNKAYLNLFDKVFVRESNSLSEIVRDGRSDAEMVPDLSLYTEVGPRRDINQIGGGIIVDSVRQEVTFLLSRLAISTGEPLVFMGYWHRDRFVRRNLIQSARLKLKNKSSLQILHDIDRALFGAYVITGRFHAACLSLLLGIPFVAVESNTFKISGLISDIGICKKNYFIGDADLNYSRLTSAQQFLRDSDHTDFKEIVQEYVVDAREKIKKMFISMS